MNALSAADFLPTRGGQCWQAVKSLLHCDSDMPIAKPLALQNDPHHQSSCLLPISMAANAADLVSTFELILLLAGQLTGGLHNLPRFTATALGAAGGVQYSLP